MEILLSCPLCNSSDLRDQFTCADHTATHETFHLQKCGKCSFIITNPRPDDSSLPKYYQSDQYISHTGRSKGIIGFLYLKARLFTKQWKIGLITKYGKPGSLLDYGCGTGELLTACLNKGWTLSGVEPNPAARQLAREISGINIASHPDELGNEKFDIITLWHVLEHIPDLKTIIAKLNTLLKPEGTLLIAVPNHESYDASIYKQFWAAYDVPRHLWHFGKSNMELLLASNGLTIKTIIPMKLDSYYVSMLSENYRAPKRSRITNLMHGISTGIKSNLKAKRSMNYSSLIYVVTR